MSRKFRCQSKCLKFIGRKRREYYLPRGNGGSELELSPAFDFGPVPNSKDILLGTMGLAARPLQRFFCFPNANLCQEKIVM